MSAAPRVASVTQPRSNDGWEQVFLSVLPTIRTIVSRLARRHRLSPSETDDFAAEVQLHIIDDNYAVLRKHAGQCTLARFLTVVIQRFLFDYCNAQWGKWRPSMGAKREGPLAIQVERLMARDGFSLDEAHMVLETNHRVVIDREALERVYSRVKTSGRPRLVSAAEIGDLPAVGASADSLVDKADRQRVLSDATRALSVAMASRSQQDRLLLTLYFRDQLTIAAIARRLGMNQKRLYQRVARLLSHLRSNLESAGVTASEVFSAVGANDVDASCLFWMEA